MKKYSIYCDTEKRHVEVISNTPPTFCPNDSTHVVNTSRVFLVEEDVSINDGGSSLDDSITLDDYKQLKYNEIDNRTGELIVTGGFVYDGKNFSLRETSQLNLLGVQIKRNDPILPLTFNNRDNTATVILATPTDVDNFFMAALGTKKAHLDSGTALKDSVRTATSRAEVDAVIDNR